MEANTATVKINEARLRGDLESAVENLDGTTAKLLLDFSSVRRIDADGVRALNRLADVFQAKNIKVQLQSVSIDVYKALTLMKMTQRFCVTDKGDADA